MTTINLEKSLIRENRKLATPKELLLVKEYETHTELLENDALSRIGFNQTIKRGEQIKTAINTRQQQTENFQQERVFHVSQIKAICEKYHLRFLPGEHYKGIIDKELPTKITNFEAAYGVKCNSSNTKICAPLESFELEEKPKDPLLFYQINDEYYYLIHKWGNDLNIVRALFTLFTNGWFCWFAPIVGFSLLSLFGGIGVKIVFVIITLIWTAACLIERIVEDRPIRFLPKNDWDSKYLSRN